MIQLGVHNHFSIPIVAAIKIVITQKLVSTLRIDIKSATMQATMQATTGLKAERPRGGSHWAFVALQTTALFHRG
jgi:hypothetical protein